VAKFLTQEWLDLQKEFARELPERPGASARIEYKVSGAPGGDVTFHTVIDNGKIADNALGGDPQAELTMTVGYNDFKQVNTGGLEASAAFMQGRVKIAGNMGQVMSLMPLLESAEYHDVAERLDASTEY
jgi:putative sterol carrier protein